MIALSSTKQGTLLGVKVQPGARRNGIMGQHAGALKVSVTQAAEKGKANAAVIKVVSVALKISPVQVQVVAGATSRRKRLLVCDIDASELRIRIDSLWAGADDNN